MRQHPALCKRGGEKNEAVRKKDFVGSKGTAEKKNEKPGKKPAQPAAVPTGPRVVPATGPADLSFYRLVKQLLSYLRKSQEVDGTAILSME